MKTLAAIKPDSNDVFRSMRVQMTSKTPYSDATQVGLLASIEWIT